MLTTSVHSQQNYIYIGSQQFEATSTWVFYTPSANSPGSIELSVAKTKNGGYLMLEVGVPVENLEIAGIVSMILQNGKLITLNQKVVNDHVDSKSKVLYTLNATNYSLLKVYNIKKIRFSIYDTWMRSTESFTASIREYDGNETAEEISELEDIY